MARVLLVDDDETDLQLMRTLLEGEGHALLVAANGEDALRLYLRHSVDVVVTDMQMPRGDGLELITALRGLDPDATIVAVSGVAPLKLKVAQQEGARWILSKPITKESLTEAVSAALVSRDPKVLDPADEDALPA